MRRRRWILTNKGGIPPAKEKRALARANADVSTGRVFARACFVFGSRCMNEAEEAI
jgi:hypothetical protein